jgi:hypothetical protein
MMRNAVLIVAVLLFGASLAAFFENWAAWPFVLMTGLIILGTVFERFNYRGSAAPDAAGPWKPTNECFRDEESGRLVTVWFNPATGERRYVEDGA